MQYYSTNHSSKKVSLYQAITHSEAPDGGIYMPSYLPHLPKAVFNNIAEMNDCEIAYLVANSLLGEDLSSVEIKRICDLAFSKPIPFVKIEPGIFSLELFHGPTLNAKDIAFKFMAHLLVALHRKDSRPLNVLVCTNGNSGSAVANGFYGINGLNVFILHPRDVPSHRLAHISSLRGNVHVIKVDGTIDDCRSMVCSALKDPELNKKMLITSANSVNIARILPHIISYFIAYARLKKLFPQHKDIYVSVPTGNGGGLMAGYMAYIMNLPIKKLIASCNSNASFAKFLSEDNAYQIPKLSTRTLAYAMDTCRPTNIPRFKDICGGNLRNLREHIEADICTDLEIEKTIKDVYERTGYMLEPHSAVGYKCLKDFMTPDRIGILMSTAHPGRSVETIYRITGVEIEPPEIMQRYIDSRNKKHRNITAPTYPALKKYILNTLQS